MLRLAGQVMRHPVAMAGYGVGGTLAAKAVMAPNQFEQLKQIELYQE